MKGNKGITLIALIVTIIVLIILAGVAIAMLRGDNGILNRAAEARYDTVLSTVDEQVKLAAVNVKTSITSQMVSKAGYIATESERFAGLVKEVSDDLSAASTKAMTGFTVLGFLDPSSNGTEGTGYIFITYSDNSLRASLPTNTSGNVVAQSFNGIPYATVPAATTQTPNAGVSANLAVVTYAIKVTNYGCKLSTPIICASDLKDASGNDIATGDVQEVRTKYTGSGTGESAVAANTTAAGFGATSLGNAFVTALAD